VDGDWSGDGCATDYAHGLAVTTTDACGRTGSSALGFAEANRLILVASVLNLVLPSKIGDIAKAYFLSRARDSQVGLCRFRWWCLEKACDMLSLLLWCAFGLMFYPVRIGFFLGHDWQCDIWTRCGLLLAVLTRSFKAVLSAIAKSDRAQKLRQAGEVAWSLIWYFGVTNSN